jgi:hypothetical protein
MTRALAVLLVFASFGCERVEWLGKETGGAPLAPEIPRRVEQLSDPSARDTDPTLTADLCELFFMSDRLGSKDLWTSRRDAPDEPWGAPEPVDSLNSDVVDENPHVSGDGLRLWFYTDRDRGQGTIWLATRDTVEDPWATPVPVPELGIGTDRSNVAVGVAENETLLVLNSLPPGGTGYELYQQERESVDDPFGEPIHIEEVGSDRDEFDPELRANGLLLAFHSMRLGSADIFRSTRESVADAFGSVEQVESLNSPYEDGAPAISLSFAYVLFSSDREGTDDIFEAHWPDAAP